MVVLVRLFRVVEVVLLYETHFLVKLRENGHHSLANELYSIKQKRLCHGSLDISKTMSVDVSIAFSF